MLKEILSRVAKDSLIYGVGNGLTRFVQLFMLPIITRGLSLSEFGDWNLLALSASILSAIMIFGLDSAIIRFFYDDDSNYYRKKLFSSGLLLMSFISLILFIFFWNLSEIVLNLINLSSKYTYSYKITVFWMPGMAFQMYLLNWFKWTLQKWKFIIITFGFVGLSLLFLVILKSLDFITVESILLSATVSQWLAVILGLFLCKKYFTIEVDFSLLRKVIPYGIPFMLVMLVGALRNSLDRFFLAEYAGEHTNIVGLYSMSQRLGMFMNFFVFTLDIAISPLIFSHWNKPNASEAFARLQRYYLLAVNWIGISICAVSPILVKLLATEEYLSVVKLFPFFIISNYILGLYMFASIGISFSKKSYLNTIALLVSLFTLYSLAYFLTPRFFEWGASFAYTVSIFVMIISGYLFSRKHFQIIFDWKIDLVTILVGGSLCFLAVNCFLVKNYLLNSILTLLIVNIIFLLYVCMIGTVEEKRHVVTILKKLNLVK